MSAGAYLGIDLGTARVKVGLVSPGGELLALARARHELDVDAASGRAEQDADAWWTGLRRAVAEVLGTARIGSGLPMEILGVAVAGQGPTTTPVDDRGFPTGPAVTWLDSRAGREADELETATGLRGWALGVLPAALRLERAGGAGSTRWYLNSWEAVTLRLTGRAVTTLVPGQPFPDPDTIGAAGLDPRRIAPTCPVGSVVGGLTNDAAAALGVVAGTPVVAGLVDAFASFHGAGMTQPGDAIDVGGAAGGFGVYWDRPLDAPGGFTTPAPLPGLWSVGGAMAATGAALEWLASNLLGNIISVPDLIDEAAVVEPGADGLVFVPYLAGERSPLWDPSARGVLAGLTLGHRRGAIARAVLEGAALAIRHVAEPILDAGARVDAMRVCGGPAHSPAWNRIKADVTGFDVAVPRVLETTVLGAAIVAAVGTGAQPDVPAAIRSMTSIAERLHPDVATRDRYDELYRRYRELHPAVAPVLEGGELAAVAVGAGT